MVRIVSLVILILSSMAWAQAEPVSLFDGTSLKGWVSVEKDAAFWSVKDGSIVADSLGKKMPRNTFLFTELDYSNFEFRCMFKLTGDPKTGLVNSGIQFRSEMLASGHAKGYQADIGGPKWWGCLYDEHRRGMIAKSDMSVLTDTLKPFGWNEYVIKADGDVVTLFLNGIQTIQYHEKKADIPRKGRLALQLHSGGICRIEYKDITIKHLKGPKPAPAKVAAPHAKANTKTAPAAGNDPGKSVLFEGFESGTYAAWTVSGEAFGKAPQSVKKVPSYQGDLNAKGTFTVNSHASVLSSDSKGSDAPQGMLTSKPFEISLPYIRLLIGGGAHASKTCVNLLIDGKVVSSLTGSNSNVMRPAQFDVKAHKGKKAQLQIVDHHSGGWGNIGVDHIQFAERPLGKSAAVAKKTRPGKKTQSGRVKIWTPAEEQAGFTVPDGFVVELVASEKDGVINPIDLTFDDAGRLWTGTAKMYPLDPHPSASWRELLKFMDQPELMTTDDRFKKNMALYRRETKGDDKILIIESPGKKPAEVRVWSEGMAIPQSILPYKNGAFVAHGSEMLYLEDTDNDGAADKQTTVLTGYGFSDTHTMSHLLVRAPGGWVHYAHGALNKGNVQTVKSGEYDRVDYAGIARFSLDGTQHNMICRGLNNIWGFSLRAKGQWYGSEANDQGHSVTPMEPGMRFKGIGNPRLREYQPQFPAPHKFRVGATGLSGLAICDDRSGGFPKEYQGVAFLANPITSKINAVRAIRNADGSIEAEHLPDFLESTDDWFRPVNLVFGPDGCLYVADFYNKIISHNEVSRGHPERDKAHGRIWRIRHVAGKAKPVNVASLKDADLPAQLESGIVHVQRAAWHQIVDRHAKHLAPALIKLCSAENADETTRILARWSLEGLGIYNQELMDQLLQSELADLRREAVRALGSMPLRPDDLAKRLKLLAADENAMVRSQVLRTLSDYGRATPALIDVIVDYCKPDSATGNAGPDYQRKFERYLARMTLEQYSTELTSYLDSKLAVDQPAEHIEWAMKALSIEARSKEFLTSWPEKSKQPLTKDLFVEACGLLRSADVQSAVKSVFQSENSEYLVKLAVDNVLDVSSSALSELLRPVCKRMLESDDSSQNIDAVQAVDLLSIDGLDQIVAATVAEKLGDEAYIESALTILQRNASGHVELFKQALADKRLSVEARLTALTSLAEADAVVSKGAAKSALKRLPDSAHEGLAHRLVRSSGGTSLLLDLLSWGTLNDSIVDRELAEAMTTKSGADARAKGWLKKTGKARKAVEKVAHDRIRELTKIAKKGKGAPEKGLLAFKGVCLSCHTVGGEGAGFAPPLDGSGYRDTEHLLTALVDPDAAVEGSYALYRIFKPDGSKLEGFLESEGSRGVTLRFMGGARLFVPRTEIVTQGYVTGRSVMPSQLMAAFSDAQVADLLAYISTLK